MTFLEIWNSVCIRPFSWASQCLKWIIFHIEVNFNFWSSPLDVVVLKPHGHGARIYSLPLFLYFSFLAFGCLAILLFKFYFVANVSILFQCLFIIGNVNLLATVTLFHKQFIDTSAVGSLSHFCCAVYAIYLRNNLLCIVCVLQPKVAVLFSSSFLSSSLFCFVFVLSWSNFSFFVVLLLECIYLFNQMSCPGV